jgi:hypothetical protein
MVTLIRSPVFFSAIITPSRTAEDVTEAIASIGRTASTPRLILKTVGTVDQKKTARRA